MGGTQKPFVPTMLDGLSLYYKSDAGLFTDAGTTPAANDGDLIYQMNDQASTYNAVASTEANRPTLQNGAADLINGLPVVRFDGTDDVMTITQASFTDFTAFFAGKWINGNDGLWGSADTRNGIAQLNNTQVRIKYNNPAGTLIDVAGASTANTTYVFVIRREGQSTTVRINGTQTAAFTSVEYALATADFIVNRIALAVGAYGYLDMLESGIYNSALSLGLLAKLEAYLSTRSGVPF